MDDQLDATTPREYLLEKRHCPLCSSSIMTPFYHRPRVPLLTNMLLETQEAARSIPLGDIQLVICENCGFIFNSSFTSLPMYNEYYDNSQAAAPTFQHYISKLVHDLVTEHDIQHRHIVEVGCGDGFFLRRLVEAGVGNTGYGFDPSHCGPLQELDGRIQFEPRYYDATCSSLPVEILICRHVIEHIPHPLGFLRMLHQGCIHFPHARLFLETPSVEWILRNHIFWDIFYEHCSYFSPHTITYALEHTGFTVKQVKHTFEKQYLWIEAHINHLEHAPQIGEHKLLASLALQFPVHEQQFIERWARTITTLRQDGPVALLGAAGKGVTFANLIDPDCQLISCVVDLNPNKQGKYLSGTGHPIVSYEGLRKYHVTSAIVMNPNYYNDALHILRSHQLQIKLLVDPISSLEHFSEMENHDQQAKNSEPFQR